MNSRETHEFSRRLSAALACTFALSLPFITLGCEDGVLPDCPARSDFPEGEEGDTQWRNQAEALNCVTPASEGDAGCPGQDRNAESQAEWQARADALGCFDTAGNPECPGQYDYETLEAWQSRACDLRCWPKERAEASTTCNVYCPGQMIESDGSAESIADWQARANEESCFDVDAWNGGYCPGIFLDETIAEWNERAFDAGCAP